MSLSDIKFNYQEKIDNLNNRMEKYEDIIKSYDKKIRKAEKEENPNVSSLIRAKGQYEHKIENMGIVKQYYQEFVDTSDYLMNHLNDNESSQLIIKNGMLVDENELLLGKNKELEQVIDDKNVELSRLKHKNISYEEKIKRKNNLINDYKNKLNEAKDRIKAKDEAYSSLRDRKTKEKTKTVKTIKKEDTQKVRKLNAENRMLKDSNDFLESKNEMLERKIQQLEDYCNHLLNRRSDELPVENSVSENNLFKQLTENTPPLVFYGVNDEF